MHSWGSRGRRFKSGRPDAGSTAGSGFQLPASGCNGSARALPSVELAWRGGVSCRPGMLTSGYRHSGRPRAGSRPFPADSGELSFRSRGRRFRSGRQRLVLGNSRWRAAPASGCQSVPPGSSRPYVERTASGCSLPPPVGQPADRPAGGHPHRSSRPLAGPVQPSSGPLRLDSPPNPRVKSGLLGGSRRSTCTDAAR